MRAVDRASLATLIPHPPPNPNTDATPPQSLTDLHGNVPNSFYFQV
jgi:hypothetical protein